MSTTLARSADVAWLSRQHLSSLCRPGSVVFLALDDVPSGGDGNTANEDDTGVVHCTLVNRQCTGHGEQGDSKCAPRYQETLAHWANTKGGRGKLTDGSSVREPAKLPEIELRVRQGLAAAEEGDGDRDDIA